MTNDPTPAAAEARKATEAMAEASTTAVQPYMGSDLSPVEIEMIGLNAALRLLPAEARATKATEDEEHTEWLHRGIDFALTQLCKWMGVEPQAVSWDAATETVDGDVSAVIGNIMRAKMGEDWSPEAKDGAAPSPETGWRLVPLAVLAPFLHAAKHIDFFVPEAIPEMAFPVRGSRVSGDGPEPFTLTPDNFTALAHAAAAPAAPSPDLAALEELAGLLEDGARYRFVSHVSPKEAPALAIALRTAILHLKAQPNAGSSADGGKAAGQ